MTRSQAQVLAAAVVQTGAAPAAPGIPAIPTILAVPAAISSSPSSPSAPAQTQTITKAVGEQQITCQVPRPEYPGEAQQRHQTGSVTVRITIFPPHVVKQLTLIESSGNASFDAAAMRAAEGTECSDTEQRFQLFQPFAFDLSKDAGATALAQ
ncbi:energy transducer TonB [Trinickia diaoshuihuensis]|uniref:energy transducer TonB n=1 Tax=Trinickia diaoshuihuensis TaxID=2292265 RepID=UPI0013C34DE3|nr:energy transducer TonB [Trinickia diaoshuihuensis]